MGFKCYEISKNKIRRFNGLSLKKLADQKLDLQEVLVFMHKNLLCMKNDLLPAGFVAFSLRTYGYAPQKRLTTGQNFYFSCYKNFCA